MILKLQMKNINLCVIKQINAKNVSLLIPNVDLKHTLLPKEQWVEIRDEENSSQPKGMWIKVKINANN